MTSTCACSGRRSGFNSRRARWFDATRLYAVDAAEMRKAGNFGSSREDVRRLMIGVERAGLLRSCGGNSEELKRLQDSWSVVMRSG